MTEPTTPAPVLVPVDARLGDLIAAALPGVPVIRGTIAPADAVLPYVLVHAGPATPTAGKRGRDNDDPYLTTRVYVEVYQQTYDPTTGEYTEDPLLDTKVWLALNRKTLVGIVGSPCLVESSVQIADPTDPTVRHDSLTVRVDYSISDLLNLSPVIDPPDDGGEDPDEPDEPDEPEEPTQEVFWFQDFRTSGGVESGPGFPTVGDVLLVDKQDGWGWNPKTFRRDTEGLYCVRTGNASITGIPGVVEVGADVRFAWTAPSPGVRDDHFGSYSLQTPDYNNTFQVSLSGSNVSFRIYQNGGAVSSPPVPLPETTGPIEVRIVADVASGRAAFFINGVKGWEYEYGPGNLIVGDYMEINRTVSDDGIDSLRLVSLEILAPPASF